MRYVVLAGICVSLLLLDDLETDPLSAENLDDHVSTVQYQRYCDSHVLLKHAAEWWTTHLNLSPAESQKALLQESAQLCNVRSRRCWTWLRVKKFAEDDYQPSGFTGLILASDLELTALAKYLLLKGVDVNARDEERAAALNRAVRHGNLDLVRTMLDNGADIEAGDWDTPWRKEIETDGSEREVKKFCGAPLMLATLREDHCMMLELLAAGADLEARTSVTNFVRDTTLHLATNYGEEPTMRILLENGAEVHAGIDDRGQFEKLARMTILRKNLDVYGTALEIAVWKHDAAKVGLLLDYEQIPEQKYFLNDEDHEIESSCLHTDLSGGKLSISVGRSDTQKAFGGCTPGEEIEHDTKTGSSRTDISIDVDYLESELICVDEVEDLDQIDDMYHDQTIAIWDGDVYIGPAFDGKLPPDEIVEEWEHTAKAIRKMTLLHIAASKGTKHVVRLLLRHGACERPESGTLAEPTALHLAALLGQSQVVKVLLDRTVNVDPRDINGFTPLLLYVTRSGAATTT